LKAKLLDKKDTVGVISNYMAKGNHRPHIGFAGFFVVITLGLVLMLMNIGLSLGLSFRIPFTQANLTLVGCLGEKNKAVSALPSYVQGRLASNKDFMNHSMTTTIGPIEGCEMGIIGDQPGAPLFGIHINAK
jgi:hypothetical protein